MLKPGSYLCQTLFIYLNNKIDWAATDFTVFNVFLQFDRTID
jgi:hypothetical protein